DRIHRAKRVNHHVSSTTRRREFRGKRRSNEVQFRRKRTFTLIQWDVFKEPAEVIEDLGLAVACRIKRRARTRRPLAGKAAGKQGLVSDDALLLVSQTDVDREPLVEADRVLPIKRMIVGSSIENGLAVFAAILTKVDRQTSASRNIHQRTERAT